MKKINCNYNSKKIIMILLLLLSVSVCGTEVSAETSTLSEYQNAFIETAKAFWRKGTNVQYDSYHKRFTRTPEDATKDELNYTVCSAFVYSVYNQALGIELPTSTSDLMRYAMEKQETEYVPYYKEYVVPGTDAEYKAIYNKMQNNEFSFQVGDILVLRWSKSDSEEADNEDDKGHVMMVLSVNGDEIELIHSDGHNKNGYTFAKNIRDRLDEEDSTKSSEGRGSIKISSLKEFLRNNFCPTDYEGCANSTRFVTSFSVIRPLATQDGKYWKENITNKELDEDGNVIGYDYEYKYMDSSTNLYGITSAAKLRIKYSLMDVYKTGSMHTNSIVDLGDRITYTIKIKNNSNKDYIDMSIVENISPYVDIIEYGDGIYSSESMNLSWDNITVSAGKTKTIKYTVQVKNNMDYIGESVISTGKIENKTEKISVSNAVVKNQIANTLTNSQEQALIETYNSLSNTSTKTGLAFINEIYEKSLVAKSGLGYDASLSSYLVTSNGEAKGLNDILVHGSRHFVDREKYDSISPNIFRGRYSILKKYAKSSYQTISEYETDLLTRGGEKNILPENLRIGDIIVFARKGSLEEVSETIAYLYLGDKLVGRSSSGLEIFYETPRKNEDEYAIEETVDAAKNNPHMNQILANLSAYYGYFILSPAMVPSVIEDEKILGSNMDENINELTNPKTGSSFIFVVIGFVILSISLVIYFYKKYQNNVRKIN